MAKIGTVTFTTSLSFSNDALWVRIKSLTAAISQDGADDGEDMFVFTEETLQCIFKVIDDSINDLNIVKY